MSWLQPAGRSPGDGKTKALILPQGDEFPRTGIRHCLPFVPGAAWICSLGSEFLRQLPKHSRAQCPQHCLISLENANPAMSLFGTDLQAGSWSVPEVHFQELISHYSKQYLCCGVASAFSNNFDTLDKRISIIINQNTMDFTGYCFNSGMQPFLCLLSPAHWLQLYNTGTEHSSSA